MFRSVSLYIMKEKDMSVIKEHIAYFCWAFGGIFGLHHFYLGRDIQAFVWFATFGGGIVGWIYDYRKIPEYVKEANGENDIGIDFGDDLADLLNIFLNGNRRSAPKATWTLYIGQLCMGVLFSSIFRYAIPIDYLFPRLHYILMTFLLCGAPIAGTILGVYLATNLGSYKVHITKCFSESGFSWLAFYDNWDLIYMLLSLSAAHAANNHLEWSDPKTIKKEHTTFKHSAKRCFVAVCCCFVYLALLFAASNNRGVVTRRGHLVSISEAAQEYLMFYRHHGLRRLSEDSMNYIDPDSRYRSYWVLGYRTPWMTEGEIKSYCRKLSAHWHPDKYTTLEDKVYAETRYKTIANACDIIKQLKKTAKL